MPATYHLSHLRTLEAEAGGARKIPAAEQTQIDPAFGEVQARLNGVHVHEDCIGAKVIPQTIVDPSGHSGRVRPGRTWSH